MTATVPGGGAGDGWTVTAFLALARRDPHDAQRGDVDSRTTSSGWKTTCS